MSAQLLALILTPLILFLVFVAPIWLILHYRSKNKMGEGLNEHERAQFFELIKQAETLTTRVKTLEQLLDQEHQGWRHKIR